MAVGGWDYYTSRLILVDHNNDAAVEAWIDQIIALLTSVPNWSVYQARTKYQSDSGWFFTVQNSVTLAQLVMVFLGDVTSTSTYILAANNSTGANIVGANYEYSIWIAYIPPGASVAASNPSTAGFLPAQGFLLTRWDQPSGEVNLSGYQRLHVMVRDDDDLIMAWTFNEDSGSWINRLAMFGGFVVPIHAADVGSRKNEGQTVCSDGRNLSDGATTTQFFKADNTTRLIGSVNVGGYPWSGGSFFYTHDYPWPWIELVIYKSGNPTTDGVVVGNGIKGYMNHEWYRLFQGEAPAVSKQRFDSGNFVFLGNWGMVGWDPSNGEMK